MSLASEDVGLVCGLIEDLCGIALDESKTYLIECRLGQILRREALGTYAELARRALESSGSRLASEIVDAITTHETLFFRDQSPFEALRHKVLPELIDARSAGGRVPRIRIWSAACSTGQEPYSIAIALCRLIPDIENWHVSILATDISDACVEKAAAGVFAEHEITRGLDPAIRGAYFTPSEGGWKINEKARRLVSFQERNLVEPFGDLGTFDVIFCRNVAIYFGEQTRRNLFERLADSLATDGALFVGSTESLVHLGQRFAPLHHCRAVYYEPNRTARQF